MALNVTQQVQTGNGLAATLRVIPTSVQRRTVQPLQTGLLPLLHPFTFDSGNNVFRIWPGQTAVKFVAAGASGSQAFDILSSASAIGTTAALDFDADAADLIATLEADVGLVNGTDFSVYGTAANNANGLVVVFKGDYYFGKMSVAANGAPTGTPNFTVSNPPLADPLIPITDYKPIHAMLYPQDFTLLGEDLLAPLLMDVLIAGDLHVLDLPTPQVGTLADFKTTLAAIGRKYGYKVQGIEQR